MSVVERGEGRESVPNEKFAEPSALEREDCTIESGRKLVVGRSERDMVGADRVKETSRTREEHNRALERASLLSSEREVRAQNSHSLWECDVLPLHAATISSLSSSFQPLAHSQLHPLPPLVPPFTMSGTLHLSLSSFSDSLVPPLLLSSPRTSH